MRPSLVLSMTFLLLAAAAASAQEPCAGFKWDVRREQSLFAGPGTSLPAGKDLASAPLIGTDRLYALQLLAQSAVTFALTPGKQAPAEGAYAGLATLKLDRPGHYRVALDLPFWVDVVANGTLATAIDFQGQRGCDAPHKIVEFELIGAKQYVLQMSAASQAVVRVSVTQVLPPKP